MLSFTIERGREYPVPLSIPLRSTSWGPSRASSPGEGPASRRGCSRFLPSSLRSRGSNRGSVNAKAEAGQKRSTMMCELRVCVCVCLSLRWESPSFLDYCGPEYFLHRQRYLIQIQQRRKDLKCGVWGPRFPWILLTHSGIASPLC